MSKKPPKYTMKLRAPALKHLGRKMYPGAMPAILELVSNAYDAMARTVKITIPKGPVSRLGLDEVLVEDDGHGMTFEECNRFYLAIGYDRREERGQETKPYNGLSPRKIQGRKGIGKLAGFGIANEIEIRSVKDGQISHFKIDFKELKRREDLNQGEDYPPEVMRDDGKTTSDPSGTVVRLSDLTIRRAISLDSLKRGIATRLLVLDNHFSVYVNGEKVGADKIQFKHRFPDPQKDGRKWNEETLEGGHSIRWWAGFTKGPIPEKERRGFAVFCRGRMAQTPFFFGRQGGTTGEYALDRFTGVVEADFLEEGDEDLIYSNRQGIDWEHPDTDALQEWGREKIKELAKEWWARHIAEKEDDPVIADYRRRIALLPERDRKTFEHVATRILKTPGIDLKVARELIEFCYHAMTNRGLLEAVKRLNASSPKGFEEFTQVIEHWGVIEAVHTAYLVKGRVDLIRTLRRMIERGAREKPEMHDLLRENPWLIDPSWTSMRHEAPLDMLLEGEYHRPSTGKREGRKRPDFFCFRGDYRAAYVIEVKRPGKVVGVQELEQIRSYVLFLREHLKEDTQGVTGILVADGVRPEAEVRRKEGAKRDENGLPTFEVRPWRELLTTAENMHREFLQVVKERAPQDDPRMEALEDEEGEGAAVAPPR